MGAILRKLNVFGEAVGAYASASGLFSGSGEPFLSSGGGLFATPLLVGAVFIVFVTLVID